MTTYAELRLRIDRGVTNRSYRIVATGPAGEALGRFKLPFSDLELENFVLRVGRTRRGTRRIESPEMELAKDFGAKLFGALFEGDVRELYPLVVRRDPQRGAGPARDAVAHELAGAPAGALGVPVRPPELPVDLRLDADRPLPRPATATPPDPDRPAAADPGHRQRPQRRGIDRRDPGADQARRRALKPLIEAGSVAIDWLEEASLRALQRQLRRGDYHVLHYIGHGGYDHEADDGVLLFEDEQGRGRKVTGVQLGTILADEVSLRLAGAELVRRRSNVARGSVLRCRDQSDRARDPGRHRDAVRDHRPRGDHLRGRVLLGAGRGLAGRFGRRRGAQGDLRR